MHLYFFNRGLSQICLQRLIIFEWFWIKRKLCIILPVLGKAEVNKQEKTSKVILCNFNDLTGFRGCVALYSSSQAQLHGDTDAHAFAKYGCRLQTPWQSTQ
jgi:hypothetical protein